MDMTIRPMTGDERLYCYSQSQQLMVQTGCIGHLRGDMGSNGEQFFSTWEDHQAHLKTDEFKAEFDDVVNALRFDMEYNGALKNRRSLANFCWDNPGSRLVPGEDDFGFRVDTENYSYLLRLNPNRGMYNIYCYCYQREWLDNHLQNAAKGIRFIDPHYNEKFRIPDGDKVRIITRDGEQRDMFCRYIDDYHFETTSAGRSTLYHICEFAERFEQNGDQAIYPMRSSLPDRCYSTLDSTGEVIIIQKGDKGYYRIDITDDTKEANRALVDEQNVKMGVSRAQEEAMKAGSMFGWDVPAADPKNYDDAGRPIPARHERSEAR